MKKQNKSNTYKKTNEYHKNAQQREKSVLSKRSDQKTNSKFIKSAISTITQEINILHRGKLTYLNFIKPETQEKKERLIVITIISFAMICSTICFIYFYSHNLTTAYSDAKAHLNIARRIFDNLTPGFAQLGGIWLPLLHILMLPTIWNDFMWHSGLSGSIINMIAYVISVYVFYKLTFQLIHDEFLSLIIAVIFGLNINLLYLQTTPMTEVLFLATLLAGVYYLIIWNKTNTLYHLILSAIFFALSAFNRYEGWPVVIVASVFIGIISFIQKGKSKAESNVILFTTLSIFTIILWLIWQLAIFHNPLYFLNSEFSARTQTHFAVSKGSDPTFNNLTKSIETFFYSLIHVDGIILVLFAIIGLLIFLYKFLLMLKTKDKKNILINLPIIILMIPGIFLIYTLYKGDIPVDIPEIHEPNHLYFNVRYAIYSLPVLILLVFHISKKAVVNYLIIFLLIVNNILLINQNNAATIQDATGGKSIDINKGFITWKQNYYHGGLILISAGTSDPLIFDLGLDMKTYITEGNGDYWVNSIKNPSKYATWVVISSSEKDSIKIHFNLKLLSTQFKPVFSYNGYTFYLKTNNSV